MSKTPFMRQMKSAASIAGEAVKRNVPVEQVIEERVQHTISRREFLQKALLASAVLAVPPVVFNVGAKLVNAATAPRVAIVGAGLAGLTAAYRLKQAGINAQVYEASSRIGGRCFTGRNAFNEGQTYEHGGELINTDHADILNLIQELNLQVDDLWAYENGDFRVVMDGSLCSLEEFSRMFLDVWAPLQRDRKAAGDVTLYNHHTARGKQLDNMSIVDWLTANVPNGMNSKFAKEADLAYTASVGLESSKLSALSMIYAMSTSSKEEYSPFGSGGEERYHVRGGNDLIPQGLANKLSGQITLSSPLECIRKNNDGTYSLTFTGRMSSVLADYVILALPVATLRDVEINRAGFRSLKQTAIAELGVGTNSKLALQFTDRHWESLGSSGAFVSDAYQDTWEATRGQTGQSGIMVSFTGGNRGNSFGSGSVNSHAQDFLQLIEHDLPGLSAKWNGKAKLDYWPGYKWTKGSYSCYKVGQYTKFRGILGEPEGNCFFAGEHTSLQFQQFLNGAVETGNLAANKVLSRLNVHSVLT
ncbi:NAD(P)-binding protein [Paenibacillus sp. LMG 31458]|uniref:NAD(P)-binding protein n=1 Tax=Paenibacillus phytorum TaxID=2654977 RepID=A0ABX1Y0S4_9BACL|nr:NAD(P)/FAD-dependent oxidoreductase [Paenibacillus phytorum]NOU74455.1 NAD(P)-binding protein [Paenibacillus phytorum]